MTEAINAKPIASVAVTCHGAVCVRLAGVIDLAARPSLAGLGGRLASAQCTVLYIDLHEVTFADSSLINFLVQLASHLPGHATMTLCRPDAMTSQLIEMTGLHKVFDVHHDLPADWISATAAPTPPCHRPSGAIRIPRRKERRWQHR